MFPPLVFLPGVPPTHSTLLARYLPPIPEGAATEWLRQHLPIDSTKPEPPWVLDPFVASPLPAVEAARAGYCVLAVASNPILRLLLELAAAPPGEDDLRAALANLAASRKGEERLEPHLRALYTTACHRCGREIEAEAFIWRHKIRELTARIYHCPHCEDSGEYPATQADVEKAERFSASKLHRARALERIAPPGDPNHLAAQEALAAYLPRAVYALFTLINKLDTPSISASQRKLLAALLLHALDQTNNLWPHPSARTRPRQLGAPPHFRENNVWLALEDAIPLLLSAAGPVPVVRWPQIPPMGGGICILEGRLREVAPSLSQIPIGAMLTAIPRLNQAYWTLSALWAGWLWGREAVGPFKAVLHRRRYDWAWHCTALHAALSHLPPQMPAGTPLFALMGEAETGFLAAAFLAAEAAGFELAGLALQVESGQAQLEWQTAASPQKAAEKQPPIEWWKKIAASCKDAFRSHLRERGEPAGYLSLSAAALSALARDHLLPSPAVQPLADTYEQVQGVIERTLAERGDFRRFGGSEKSLESGQWQLSNLAGSNPPLANRIEKEIVSYLINYPDCRQSDVEKSLFRCFSGLLTPDSSLVRACLESYGERSSPEDERWHLRKEDTPRARRADLQAAARLLDLSGKQLGYQIRMSQGDRAALLWLADGEVVYAFYVLASAILGDIVNAISPFSRPVIVLPGGRAGLVMYKLQHNPCLRQSIEESWRFLKFRQLRWLAERSALTREQLDEYLSADPLAEEDPQMRLL